MAERRICSGDVLVLGHSFVRRLQDFLVREQVKVCGHKVKFCAIGGTQVSTLMEKLTMMDVANFCMIYVEIGSNDLCNQSGDIVALSICDLVTYLRRRGVAQIVFGQILFRTKMSAGGPSVEEF